MTVRWLDRGTVVAPYLALCLSEAEFIAAARRCGVPNPSIWLEKTGAACVHRWTCDDGPMVCVVCLDQEQFNDGIDLAAALCHEAVHVFQNLCDEIGEDSPSREFEAYSIQSISKQLMREYARRMSL